MDYFIIGVILAVLILVILIIVGLFVNIFNSYKKENNELSKEELIGKINSDKSKNLLWLGLGVLLGMSIFD